MNAPMLRPKIQIRAADLRDANECAKIDAWVMAHEAGLPFHRPAWLKAIEAGTGQKAHCLIAESSTAEIAGVLPLHLIHSPLFGRALVSSGFAVGGGILSHSVTATRLRSAIRMQIFGGHCVPTLTLNCSLLHAGSEPKCVKAFRTG